MLDGIEFLLFVVGVVFNVLGWTNTTQSEYSIPPLPVGWMFGIILLIFGGSLSFASSILILNLRKRRLYWLVSLAFGSSMIYTGFRSTQKHPIEFPVCPCPTNFYGPDCLPCPGVNLTSGAVNICNGHGRCDDTLEGTGNCICDFNWRGSPDCDVCSEHFDGIDCEKCDRQWNGLACDECYPGYEGDECGECSHGWERETDTNGVLCRNCLPGYYGPFCTKCESCKIHDDLAFCRDNDWHNENLYDKNICSPTPQTCTNDYDCTTSYNCKGKCVQGSITNEVLCTSDLDCVGFGTCQFKTCCAESKFGDGNCECQRVGYFGPKCEPCPGFDNVYTSSICSSHGTCQSSYVEGEYKELICNCANEENGFWTGPECGCFKHVVGGQCMKCANGFFGPNCDMCPGGGGVSQCSLHGECSDGLSGSGTCSCDLDTKRNGLGAWGGESCSSCLSSDFYGGSCQTCPQFTFTACDGFLPAFGSTGNCMTSCGTKSCNDDGVCVTCDPGKFMNSNRRCEDCQPGKVSIDGTECITCLAGKHQSEAGKTICIDCPNGRSTSGLRGASSCDICQQGEYSVSGDATCTTCARGRYNPLVEQRHCTNCTAGKFSNETGQVYITTCTDCPLGKFSAFEGTPECEWCDIHKYQNLTGQTSCDTCRAGQMHYVHYIKEGLNTDSINVTECERVYDYLVLLTGFNVLQFDITKPAGCVKEGQNIFFNLNNYSLVECSETFKCIQKPNYCKNCSRHMSSSSGDFCYDCPNGKYSDPGGLCGDCLPGKRALAGLGCEDCPFGTYNDERGLTNCKHCPKGKSHAIVASRTASECIACNPGRYSNNFEYRGFAWCNVGSDFKMLVYEGEDNPGQSESAQAEACYNRCKSYRLHTFYDEPTPPPQILTQEQCKKYSQDHHLDWAGDSYTSAEYPKGCFIWENDMHYNLNNFSTGNCNFNNAKCVILPSKMYSQAYNATAFTLNVLSQPGRCYCEKYTYENCTNLEEGYTERNWKYFTMHEFENDEFPCHHCILGTNSSSGASYCDSCKAGSYGTINFVVVGSGYNDNSVSREECRQLSIQENRQSWAVVYDQNLPRGCYRSGNHWRFNPNGILQCGNGTDYCIQKGEVLCKKCAIGQYEDRVHSDHCKNCPDGQYQNRTGQGACRDWHLCVAGEEETSVPTKDADRDCALCPAGKASDVIYYQTPENCQQKELAILDREECLVAYNNAPYRTGVHGNRTLFHCYDGQGGNCYENYEVHENGTVTDLFTPNFNQVAQKHYKGCYKDCTNSNGRDFPIYDGAKTLQECYKRAVERGKLYFGSQFHSHHASNNMDTDYAECWLGDTYGNEGTESNCYKVNNGNYVGGECSNAVYEVGSISWFEFSTGHTYEEWQQFCSAWPNNNNVFNGGLGGCTTPVPMLQVPLNRDVGYGIQSNGCVLSQQSDQTYFGPSLLLNRNDYGWVDRIFNNHGGDPLACDGCECANPSVQYNFQYSCGSKYFCRLYESCQECPAGTYTDLDGSSECLKCADGTSSLRGDTVCSLCPAGTSSNKIWDENDASVYNLTRHLIFEDQEPLENVGSVSRCKERCHDAFVFDRKAGCRCGLEKPTWVHFKQRIIQETTVSASSTYDAVVLSNHWLNYLSCTEAVHAPTNAKYECVTNILYRESYQLSNFPWQLFYAKFDTLVNACKAIYDADTRSKWWNGRTNNPWMPSGCVAVNPDYRGMMHYEFNTHVGPKHRHCGDIYYNTPIECYQTGETFYSWNNDETTGCTNCGEGTFSEEEVSECTSCSQGRYRDGQSCEEYAVANGYTYLTWNDVLSSGNTNGNCNWWANVGECFNNQPFMWSNGNCKQMCLRYGSPEGCVRRGNEVWFNREKTTRVCGYAGVQCIEAGCKACPASTISTSRDGCCDVTFTKENYLQTTFTATTLKADSLDQIKFTGGHMQGALWSTGGPITHFFKRLDVHGNVISNKRLLCSSHGVPLEIEMQINADKYIELKQTGARTGYTCSTGNETSINYDWNNGVGLSVGYGGGNGYSIYTLTGKLCGACHLNYIDSDKSTFCSMCPINTFHSQGTCEFCPQHMHNNLTYIDIPLLEKFGEPDLTVREDDCKAYGESQIAIITSGLSEATQLQFLSATECQAYATDTERAWSGASASNGSPKGCIIINSNTIHESVMYNTLTQDAACNNQARCVQKAWHSAGTWTDRPRGCTMAIDGRVFFNKKQSTFACGAGDWTCIKELSPHMGKLQIYMKSQVPYYLGGSQVIYINENKVHETPWKNMGIIMSRLKYNRGWEMEDTLVQNPWSDGSGGTDIYKHFLNAFQYGDMLVMTTIYDYYRSEYHFNIWKSILRDDFGSIYVDEITADDRTTTAWMFVGIKGEAPILELFDNIDIEKTIQIDRGFCDTCPIGTDSTATSDCFETHPGEKHDLDVTSRKGNVALSPAADKITIRVASMKSDVLLVYDGTSSVAPITGNTGMKLARLRRENFTWVYDDHLDSSDPDSLHAFVWNTKFNEMLIYAQLGETTFPEKTVEHLELLYGITIPASDSTTTDDDEFSFIAIKGLSEPLYAGRAQWIQFPKTKTTVFSACLEGTYQDERKQVVCKECETGKGALSTPVITWSSPTKYSYTGGEGYIRWQENYGTVDQCAQDCYDEGYLFGGLYHQQTYRDCRCCKTQFGCNYKAVDGLHLTQMKGYGRMAETDACETCVAGKVSKDLQCSQCPTGRFNPNSGLQDITANDGYNDNLHSLTKEECRQWAIDNDYPLESRFDSGFIWEGGAYGCWLYRTGEVYWNAEGEWTCAWGWQHCVQKSCKIAPVGTFTNAEKTSTTQCPAGKLYNIDVKQNDKLILSYRSSGMPDHTVSSQECNGAATSTKNRPSGCYKLSNQINYYNNMHTDVPCSSEAWCVVKLKETTFDTYDVTQGKADESITQEECMGLYELRQISTGTPDLSVSLEECKAYHDNNGFSNWEVNSFTKRPKGCYQSGSAIRWSHTGTYQCGVGTDNCLEKRKLAAFGETRTSGRPYGCYRTSSNNKVYFNMEKTDVDCSSEAPCIQKRPPNDSEIGIIVNAKSRMPQIVHVGHTVKVNPHFGENGGVVATRLKMNSAGEWEYFRHMTCEYDTFQILDSGNTKRTMTLEECKARAVAQGKPWHGIRNDVEDPPGCIFHAGESYWFNEGGLSSSMNQYRACGYGYHRCLERVASSCNLDRFIVGGYGMVQNEMLVLSFHKYIEISDALRTFLTTNLKATIPRAGHSSWVIHQDYTLIGIYGKKPMREGPSAELLFGKTWLHGSARCTFEWFGGEHPRCYCSSPDYGGLDGRYHYGDSNRYTGGEATGNGVTSSAACKALCDSQPECKFDEPEVCDNCPLGKFSADTAAVTCKSCREGFRGRNYVYRNHSAVPSSQKLSQEACQQFGLQVGKKILYIINDLNHPMGCSIYTENGNLLYNTHTDASITCKNTHLCILNTSAFGNQRSNEENGCVRCRNGYQTSNNSHLVCQQCSAGKSLAYHEEVFKDITNEHLSLSLEECKELSLMEEDTPWGSGNVIDSATLPYGCVRLFSPSNSRYIVYFNSNSDAKSVLCSTLRPPEACLQATYEIAEGNTIPDKSISNEGECERAAKSLGLTYASAGSWSYHVSGCFVHTGSDVYWNNHVNGLRCQNSRDRPTFYNYDSNECLQRRKRCKQCKPGTIDNGGDRSTCTKCLPGTFTYGSGEMSCDSCGANKINPSMGQNVWKFQTKGYPKKDVTYQECASYANDIDESSFHEIATDLQPAGCTYRYDNGYTYYNTKNNHLECGSTTTTGTYACLVKTCTDCRKGSRLTDTNPYVINIGTAARKNVNREECLEFAHHYCSIHSSTCDTGNLYFLYVLQNYHNTGYPTGCFLYTTNANKRRFYYNNAISSTSCNAGTWPSGCVEKKYEYVQNTDSLPDLSLSKDECRHYAKVNDLNWRGETYIHPSETIGCFLYDNNKIYYNTLRPFKNTVKCSSSFKCIEKKNECTKCSVGKYHKMNIQPTNQSLTPVAGKFTVEFNSHSGKHYYTNPIKLWNGTTKIVDGDYYSGWKAVRLRYSNQWEFHSENVSGYLWTHPERALRTKEYLETFEEGDMLILGHGEVSGHNYIHSVLTSDFKAKLITTAGRSWRPYHLIAIKGVGVIHEEYLEEGPSGAPLRRHLPYLQFDKVTPSWTCENCPTGYYQDETGQVGCKACDLGKYHIYNNALPGSALASHCEKCPAGKYQNRRGQNFCWECDPGHTTQGTDGTVNGEGAYYCTACPTGKSQSYYKSSTTEDNTVSKEECLAIKNSNSLAVNTNVVFEVDELYAPFGCFTVHNGAITSSEQIFWNDLKDSTWSSSYYSIKELTSCFDCGTSMYQDETGQTTCKNCAAGKSSASWSVTGYIYEQTGEYARWQENYGTVSSCSAKCAERGYPFGGMYHAPSGTWRDCRCCKTQYGCGYTSTNSNSGVMMHVTVGCSECAAGTYADYYPSQSGAPDNLIGELECKSLNGVFSQSVTTADADFFISRSDIPFGCLISYWHAGSSWNWQYYIKFNRYRSSRACDQTAGVTCIKRHRTCQFCAPGKYSTGGLAECLDCPLGSATNIGEGSGSRSCTQCAAGKYSGANLVTSGYNDFSISVNDCSILPNWKTTGNPDKVTRSDRPYGCAKDTQNEELIYYSNPILHLLNSQCSASYPCYQQDLTCQDCPRGKYSTTIGGTWHGVCQNCPAGKFLDTTGATAVEECQTCPAGKYSVAGSSQCFACVPGTFSGAGAASCTTCGFETFQTEAGQPSCTACQATCGVGHQETTQCTPLTDRYCSYCPVNHFAYTHSGGCAPILGITNFAYATMYLPHSQPLGVLTFNGHSSTKTTITSIVKTHGHNSYSTTTGINQWFTLSGHATFNKIILDGKRSTTTNSQRAILLNTVSSRLTMTDCIIKSFSADAGPAIRISNSIAAGTELINTQILYNVATANFGAIYDTASKTLQCTGCIFQENISPHYGSAIDTYGSTVILTDCDFINNAVGLFSEGYGAIRQSMGSLKMTNVRFKESTPHALAINYGTSNQPTLDFTDVFLLKNELCDPGEYGYLKWHDGWNDEFMDQYQQSQVCQKCDMGKHANYIKYRDTARGNGCGEEASLSQAECGNAAFEFGYYDIHVIESGRPDLSMTLAECKAYHDNNDFDNWSELSVLDAEAKNRPKGCYKSGSAIRWSHTGTLDCGQGTDNCLEKRPKTPAYDTQTHAPHGCFMDGSTLFYFDNGLHFDRSYTAPYYFCYEGTTRKESCEECTVGKFSTTVGAASASTCETCEAGKFADQTGAVVCKDCPIGFRSARNFEYYTTAVGPTSFSYVTRQECEDFANQIGKPFIIHAATTEPRGCYQRFYNGDQGTIRYNPGSYACTDYCLNAHSSFRVVKKQPILNPPTSHNCTYCASNRYSLAEGSSACINCPTNRVVEYPMFIAITTQSTLSWDQANEFMVSKEDCLEADAQFEAMGLGGSYGAGNLLSTMEGSWSNLPYGCTYWTDENSPQYNRVVFNTHSSPVEFRHRSNGYKYNNRICMVGVEVEKSYVVLESEELRCDDIELCTYQYYGQDNACYCSSPDYGGMDGRYGFGNPNRYTGGWATANGVTSDTKCRLTCKAQPECTLLTVTKDECQDAKDTLGLDGSNGDQFEVVAEFQTMLPSGCSHYTDPGAMSYNRVQWNPGLNGQDSVKDTVNSACTSTSHWCYRSYNRRVCKKHDKLKKRFTILESTSQKCSDILRLPTSQELIDSSISMPGLDRWVPTVNSNLSYAFNGLGGHFEKDYIEIGNINHVRGKSHVKHVGSFPGWDTQTQAYKALVLLPVPCDGCAAGKYSTVGESTCKDCPMGKTNAANMYTCLNCIAGQHSAMGEDKCTLCEDLDEVSLVFHYFEGESDNTVTEDECSKMGEYDGTTTHAARPTGCYIYTANGHFIYNLATSGVPCSSAYGCVGRSRNKYEVLTNGFPMTESYEIVATNEATEYMTQAECRELYNAHPGPKNPYCLSTNACNSARPIGCSRLWAEGQWYFYHTSTAGIATCTGSYRCYRKKTNFFTFDSTECENIKDDLGKTWAGVGGGLTMHPGCMVSGENIGYYDNSATEESRENHIVGYEFVRNGECANNGDNQRKVLNSITCTGDGFDCIEKCYKECKRQNDLGLYPNKGFIVNNPTGPGGNPCYCESDSGRDCTYHQNNGWYRYDYIYKGFKSNNAFAAVSKTCGKTCPLGSFKYGTVCAPCQPGNYCPGNNLIVACPAGTFSNGYNATECQSCVPGKTSSSGSMLCTDCAQGKYSGYKLVHEGRPDKSIGYHLCKSYGGTSEAESWFPAKDFEEVNLADRPQGCYVDLAYTYNDDNKKKVRWNKNFGNKVCSPMYPCVQRMTTCDNCPIGRFNEGTGNDKCTKIPDGRYGTTNNPDGTESYGWSQCSAGTYKKQWRKVVDGKSNDATVTYDDCKAIASELGFNFYEFSTSGKIDYGGTIPSKNLPMHSCGGDCDYDSDCAGNMKCFETNAGIVPPGCNAGFSAMHDWCYTPSETLVTDIYNDASRNIPLCGGDCDRDSDCAGDYVCFQRDGTTAIPGCAGSARSDYDFCVSPQSYTKSGLKQPAQVGTFDSSLFVSPKGCFMHKGLTTRLYYNVQDSPAACTEDRPCVQYTLLCETCGKGKYSTVGATECTNCDAGKTSVTGASSCINCGAGTYDSEDWGRNYQVQHYSGFSFAMLDGNGLSYDDCKTYAEENSLTFHGFYSSSGGIFGCFKETGHVYYNSAGNRDTTSHSQYQLIGYYDVCDSCAVGYYQPSVGQSSCITCAPGLHQPSTGQTACIVCNPGTFQDGTAQTTCKSCSKGKYQDVAGQTSCKDCEVGKYSDTLTSTSCLNCQIGRYNDETGKLNCQACRFGQTVSTTGSTECEYCPRETDSYYHTDTTSITGSTVRHNAINKLDCQNIPGYDSEINDITKPFGCVLEMSPAVPVFWNNAVESNVISYSGDSYRSLFAKHAACTACQKGTTTNTFCGTNEIAAKHSHPGGCLMYAGGDHPSGSTWEDWKLNCQSACMNPKWASKHSSYTCNFVARSFLVATNNGRCWCFPGDSTGTMVSTHSTYRSYDLGAGCHTCKTCDAGSNPSFARDALVTLNIPPPLDMTKEECFEWADLHGIAKGSSTYSHSSETRGCFLWNGATVYYNNHASSPGKCSFSSSLKCIVKEYRCKNCYKAGQNKYKAEPLLSRGSGDTNQNSFTFEACQAFATSLGYTLGRRFTSDHPVGCYMRDSISERVYFNQLQPKNPTTTCSVGVTCIQEVAACITCQNGQTAKSDGTGCEDCADGYINIHMDDANAIDASECQEYAYIYDEYFTQYNSPSKVSGCVATDFDQSGSTRTDEIYFNTDVSGRDRLITSDYPAHRKICRRQYVDPGNYYTFYIAGDHFFCRGANAACVACPAGTKQVGMVAERSSMYLMKPEGGTNLDSNSYSLQECKALSASLQIIISSSAPHGCVKKVNIYYYNMYMSNVFCNTNGYECIAHQRECHNCLAGQFASNTGSSSCTKCAPGQYADTVASTTCKTCASGTFAVGNGKTACIACEVGFYASDTTQPCRVCPEGKYQDEVAKGSCKSCPPGTYQYLEMSTSCEPCPVGKGHDEYGATERQVCETCERGQYTDGYTYRYHTDATLNFPTSSLSLTVAECQALSNADPLTAAAFQTNCLHDYYPGGCTKNTYSGGTVYYFNTCAGEMCNYDVANIQCITKENPPARTCKNCGKGKYQDEFGQTSCKNCAYNHWSEEGSDICETCYAGRYVSGTSECDDCAPGKYQDLPAQSGCKNCPVYHYQDDWGQDHCHMCAAMYYNTITGQSRCRSGSESVPANMNTCMVLSQVGLFDMSRNFPFGCPYKIDYPYNAYYVDFPLWRNTRPDYP